MSMISSLFNIGTSFFHSNVHTFLKYFFNSVIIYLIASLYYNRLTNQPLFFKGIAIIYVVVIIGSTR